MSGLLIGILLLLALGLAAGALRARDLLTATLVLGAYSLVLSLLWAAMGAVDVAFTEAVVGAGISTVLMLAALLRTSATRTMPRPRARWGALAATALLGATLVWASRDLPAFGDPRAPAAERVSPRYLAQGLPETGTPNIVTAVLADYRAYDTLVETVVIVTAALGCWLLLRKIGR
jgi:multicomponent Na+:H+ antiporter subunit B